jgi:activating signal cointegrator complex subunit 2
MVTSRFGEEESVRYSGLAKLTIMKLPPIVSFPPSTLRNKIVPEEWEACVDAWTTLVAIHLRLSAQDFISISTNDDSLVTFLVSYVYEVSRKPSGEDHLNGFNARLLWRECFLLAHRFLSGGRIPQPLLDWTFLADLSSTYVKSIDLRKLFESLWNRHAMLLEPGFQKLRHSLVGDLEKVSSDKSEDLASTIHRFEPLLYVSQGVSGLFMVGSDFLDALFAGYMNASQSLQRRILAVTYLGLVSLLGGVPNLSLLLDHLYGLKSLADIEEKRRQNTRSLVIDLVTNTPLIRKLQGSIGGTEAARAKSLINSLETFRDPKERRHIRPKTNKGKGRATADDNGEIHVHRMSLVTQIQDLFPDLGSGFIVRLLDEYSDNVELVTTHLLEGSLPPHLRDADPTKELYVFPSIA